MKASSLPLAAAVDEHAFVEVARNQAGQFLGQQRSLGGQKLRGDTASLLGLTSDGLDDPAVSVPEVAVEQLGEEIQVAPALAVMKVDALGPGKLHHRVLALLDGPGKEDVLAIGWHRKTRRNAFQEPVRAPAEPHPTGAGAQCYPSSSLRLHPFQNHQTSRLYPCSSCREISNPSVSSSSETRRPMIRSTTLRRIKETTPL